MAVDGQKNQGSGGQGFAQPCIADPSSLQIIPADYNDPSTLKRKVLLNLKKDVKGQDSVLEQIAQVFCDHYARASSAPKTSSHIIAGPQSSGKAYSAWAAASLLHLPVCSIPCEELDGVDAVSSHLEDAVVSICTDARAKHVIFRIGGKKEEYRNARQAVFANKANSRQIIDPAELAQQMELVRKVESEAIGYAQSHGVIILENLDKILQHESPESQERSQTVQEILARSLGRVISAKISDEYSDMPRTLDFDPRKCLYVITGEFNGADGTDPAAFEQYGIRQFIDGNPSFTKFSGLSGRAMFEITYKQLLPVAKALNDKSDSAFSKFSSIHFTQEGIQYVATVAEKLGTGARAAEKVSRDLFLAVRQYAAQQGQVQPAQIKLTPEFIKQALSQHDASYAQLLSTPEQGEDNQTREVD
jgi:hypothetical protein